MSNTLIQIKRSTTTAIPPNGSLSAGEQAYSYSSNTLFIGTPDGTGVIAIGGKYYLDTIMAAFEQANAAYTNANTGPSVSAAFNQANTARVHANGAFESANSGQITANAAFDMANLAWASATAGQITANAAFDQANTVYNFANTKLAIAGGTITGNLAIAGSLTVSGNSYVVDSETLRVSDPLIYLAGNNYVSDIVDIGFVGNYVNATGQNVHTGFFRNYEDKEYYLFQGYDAEPDANHIDINGNNFTIAVLNADLKTSNLVLGGANAIITIGAAFTHANTAHVSANSALATGNAALLAANIAHNHANAAHETANASYVFANSAHAIANIAFDQANTAYAYANAASAQAANADFITSGTLGTARLSGSYTGITGVGTITQGTWNGDTVKVPYGGTGLVSFTTNGILYGNSAGDLKVTAAGTEGQVLQASSAGVPQFGMLDGGTF